jgi:hypothetical protein
MELIFALYNTHGGAVFSLYSWYRFRFFHPDHQLFLKFYLFLAILLQYFIISLSAIVAVILCFEAKKTSSASCESVLEKPSNKNQLITGSLPLHLQHFNGYIVSGVRP